MPDDTTTDTTQDTSATAAITTDANTSGAGNGENGGDGGFKPITSEAELTAWKEATRKSMVADARKAAEADARRKADEAAAKAKGEWEELAATRQQRIDELEADAKKRDHDDLRLTIADRHKLPKALALRLAGTTEAELEADAKELAKLVKPPVAADTEAGERHRSTNGAEQRNKPGENAELVKSGASFTFMPVGAVPVPDDV